MSEIQNPYLGPEPFTQEDAYLFAGRTDEINNLLYMIQIEQAILLNAPSGAGKTSLLNAGLLPALRDQEVQVFDVVRVVRTLADIDVLRARNIFMLLALLSLTNEEIAVDELYNASLQDVLSQVYRPVNDIGTPVQRVLIFDQFEEIFTRNQDFWEQREGFFEQVRAAQAEDPHLTIVFSMRKEYVSEINNLLAIPPKATLYLTPLQRTAAIQAIEHAIIVTNSPIRYAQGEGDEPGAAEFIVDELRQIRDMHNNKLTPSKFVEPVQLQIVCSAIWGAAKRDDIAVITQDRVSETGGINETLQNFYWDGLQQAAALGHDTVDALRQWFENTLLQNGVRDQLLETSALEKVSKEALASLVDSHLLRIETRTDGNTHFYEIAHDRLVEPILAIKQREDSRIARENFEIQRKRQRLYLTIGAVIVLLGIFVLASLLNNIQTRRIASDEFARTATSNAAIAATSVAGAESTADTLLISNSQNLAIANIQSTSIALVRAAQREQIMPIALAIAVQSNRLPDYDDINPVPTEVQEVLEFNFTPMPDMLPFESITVLNELAYAPGIVEIIPLGEQSRSGDFAGLAYYGQNNQLAVVQAGSLSDNFEDCQAHSLGSYTISTADFASLEANHSNCITAFDYDPDTMIAVSGDRDGEVIRTNLQTGEAFRLTSSIEDTSPVETVANSGETIVVAYSNNRVEVWDDSGSSKELTFETCDLAAAPTEIIDVSFSIHLDNIVVSFEANSGVNNNTQGDTELLSFLARFEVDGSDAYACTLLYSTPRANSNILFSQFLPASPLIATGIADGRLVLIDALRQSVYREIGTDFTELANLIAESPDGDQVFLAGCTQNCDDGDSGALYSIVGYDVDSTQQIYRFTHFDHEIQALAVSDDSTQLATGQCLNITPFDCEIVLFDLRDTRSPNTMDIGSEIIAFVYSADGTKLAASVQGTIVIFDAQTLQPVSRRQADNRITAIAFSNDGDLIVTGDEFGNINISTAENIEQIMQHGFVGSGRIHLVQFSSDDSQLLARSHGEVTIWDVPTLNNERLLDNASVARLSPVDGKIAIGNHDGFLQIYDFESNDLLIEFPPERAQGDIEHLSFTEDGRYLLMVTANGNINIYDASDDFALLRRFDFSGGVQDVVFAPYGTLPEEEIVFALAYSDSVELYSADTGQLLRSLSSNGTQIWNLEFSPQNQQLAGSGINDILYVWQFRDRSEVLEWVFDNRLVSSLDCDPSRFNCNVGQSPPNPTIAPVSTDIADVIQPLVSPTPSPTLEPLATRVQRADLVIGEGFDATELSGTLPQFSYELGVSDDVFISIQTNVEWDNSLEIIGITDTFDDLINDYPISQNENRRLYVQLSPGLYIITVNAFDNTLEESFTIFLEEISESEMPTAIPTAIPTATLSPPNQMGSVIVNDFVDGNRQSFVDDIWTLELEEGQTVNIETFAEWDTTLELRLNGVQIAYNDDSDLPNLNSRINFEVSEPGVYDVIVSAFTNSREGLYRLGVSVNDAVLPTPQPFPTPTPLPQQFAGILTSNEEIIRNLDAFTEDVWTIELEENEEIIVQTNADFELYLSLEFENLSLASSYYIDDATRRLEYRADSAGTYDLIILADTGASGEYALTAEYGLLVLPTVPPIEYAGVLQLNTRVNGTRGSDGDDRWSLDLEVGQSIILETDASFDTTMSLFLDNEEIRYDDDAGAGLNSRIEYDVTVAGTYDVIFSAFNFSSTGDYNLSVIAFPDPQIESVAVDVLNEFITGDLDSNTITVYSVQLEADQNLVLEAQAEFDIALNLRFNDDYFVAYDNGGSDLYGRIDYRVVEPGTYEIVLTNYSDYAGSYELGISVDNEFLAAPTQLPTSTPLPTSMPSPTIAPFPLARAYVGENPGGQLYTPNESERWVYNSDEVGALVEIQTVHPVTFARLPLNISVIDPNGDLIYFFNSNGIFPERALSYEGDYEVVIRNRNSTQPMDYTLFITKGDVRTNPQVTELLDNMPEIDPGDHIGEITVERSSQFWLFRAEPGASYRISLNAENPSRCLGIRESNALDTQLLLWTIDGNFMRENDDAEGYLEQTTNSNLDGVFVPDNGIIVIEAKNFTDGGGQSSTYGNYTLSILRDDGDTDLPPLPCVNDD